MVYFGAHLRYSDWRVPPSLSNFSSDLDESHNRSLGQVGGRVPPVRPRGYATAHHCLNVTDAFPQAESIQHFFLLGSY